MMIIYGLPQMKSPSHWSWLFLFTLCWSLLEISPPGVLCQLDGEGGHVERHRLCSVCRPPIPPIPAQPRCSSKRWHLPFLCQQRIARYLRKQESYNIPLEHSWSTTQTPKWREFLHKLLVSRILGVCFFRVYIFQTLFDMIFTLVKCCSETPTPHPQ